MAPTVCILARVDQVMPSMLGSVGQPVVGVGVDDEGAVELLLDEDVKAPAPDGHTPRYSASVKSS